MKTAIESGTRKLSNDWRKFLSEASRDTGKILTGNYADYNLCKPYVCCGWMDLHSDEGYGVSRDKPYFKIRPLYWDSNTVLIVTDSSKKYVAISRTALDIKFNATRFHGFVPSLVAEELIARQDEDGSLYKLMQEMLNESECTPKLVWEWCNSDEDGDNHNCIVVE